MRTLKAIGALIVMLVLAGAAAKAGEKKAEVVPVPKPTNADDVDVLKVVVHAAEKTVIVDLRIGIECDVSKLIAKYGELKPGTKGWEKLHDLIADRLKETGEKLVKDSAHKISELKPVIVPGAKVVK